MTIFFLIAALLVVAVLVLLLPVFRRATADQINSNQPDRAAINASVARAQAADLRARLDAGEISQEVYTNEKTRLAAALAKDIEEDLVGATSAQVGDANKTGQWMFWPLAISLPVAAGLLYINLGTPQAIDPANRVAPVASAPQQQQAPDMEQIVTRIKQQLEMEPDDARGWFMLGRAHLTIGEYPEAVVALRRSLEIDDSNIDVSIRLADAVALTQQGSLMGEPVRILETALKTSPNHPQGLWLYGMALNEAGEHPQAISVWQKLLLQLTNDPASTREVEQLIANAQQHAGDVGGSASGGQSQTVQDGELQAGELQITVNVLSGVADGLPASTPVFIYAKAANGPPMPLAVVKRALADLPLTVTLSDAQAMIDTMKISAFEKVIVGARISKTGDPIQQSGDLFIESGAVDVGALQAPLQLTISETVP